MTDQPEPAHGCTIDGQPAMPILISEYSQLIADLAALRAVARGYCPACGRGDAAPTVDDWERERQRAEQAEAELRRYTEADSANAAAGSYAGRVEAAEAALDRVRTLADRWVKAGPPPLGTSLARWWDRRLVELNAALDEPAPATPATGLRWTVATQVDTHTHTGDRTATSVWLAGHPHHWNDGGLVIDTVDGPVPAPTGWILARWPDGDVTVMSPRAAAKRLRV